MKKSLSLGPILSRFSYGPDVHPARDWSYLLLLASILVAISIAWNFRLYQEVQEGATLGEEVPATPVDIAPIESVRAVFEERKAEEQKYRTEYRFVDPSR